ncbi:MAG: TRAP transporter small permease subunit [Bacteroidota bacterium]|nr:TRAP transporter small permease subunit [Bacteroidota bacterium]MDE2955476.1 TRAP transporter small permease subunit [Bacteroidota bacterium]
MKIVGKRLDPASIDRVMDRGSRIADRIEAAMDRIGALTRYCILLMVVIGCYNAIVRYVSRWSHIDPASAEGWESVLLWIGETARRMSSNMFIELQWYLFSVVLLLGAAYALRRHAHVRVDIVYSRQTLEGRAWINILGTVLFLVPFSGLMIWASWPDVLDSWARLEGSPDPGGLPRYPLLTVVPIAFALLIVQGLAYVLREAAILYDIAVLRRLVREHGKSSPPLDGD